MLGVGAFALLSLCLVTYVQHASALLAFPFEIDGGEGFDVYGAVVLLHGGELYGDPTRFPFFALNYPPVYALAAAPLVALMGPVLSAGRIVSVAAALATAVCIGLAVSVRPSAAEESPQVLPPRPAGEGSSQFPWAPLFPSVLAALSFLASAYVLHVTPLARVTSLMVCLGVAGLVCLERGVERRTSEARWIALGLGLLLAGVYTKPVGLDAAAAGVLYLLVRRPAGWALNIAGFVGVGLALHGLLQFASSGRYGEAVFTSNVYPWDFDQALGATRNFLETHGPLLGVAGLGLWAHARSRWPTVWVFYLLAGGVTALSVGRWGAGESYFFPVIIAACVLAGRAVAWGLPRDSRSYSLGMAGLGLFALTGSAGPWPLHQLVPRWDRGFQAQTLSQEPAAAEWAAGNEVVAFVKGAGGPVFSEVAGFVLLAGGQVTGNPMLVKGLDAHEGYDSTRLAAALKDGSFKGVILLGEWYPQEVLQAIGENFQTVRRIAVAGNVYRLMSPL